jgi:hypothetical protein
MLALWYEWSSASFLLEQNQIVSLFILIQLFRVLDYYFS